MYISQNINPSWLSNKYDSWQLTVTELSCSNFSTVGKIQTALNVLAQHTSAVIFYVSS